MTRAADCDAMVRAAVDAFGTLDILVNNIGEPSNPGLLVGYGNVRDTAIDEAIAALAEVILPVS